MSCGSGLKSGKTVWYRRFRAAAYVNAIGSALWTFAIVLPFAPFSYLQPIMAGGGPGIWFVLGYLVYLVVGVGGFASISSLLYVIETQEKRGLNQECMLAGLILLFVGVLAGCFLLGLAGALGGYVLIIQHSTVSAAQSILSPYVLPISAMSLAALVGAGVLVYGMAAAKAAES